MEFAFAPHSVTDSGFRGYPDHKKVLGQIPTNPYKFSGACNCRGGRFVNLFKATNNGRAGAVQIILSALHGDGPPTMTTIVLAHPNARCPRFQVFGVYDGPDDRFTFGVQEFNVRDDAERIARKMMEEHGADHFRRVMHSSERIG